MSRLLSYIAAGLVHEAVVRRRRDVQAVGLCGNCEGFRGNVVWHYQGQ